MEITTQFRMCNTKKEEKEARLPMWNHEEKEEGEGLEVEEAIRTGTRRIQKYERVAENLH